MLWTPGEWEKTKQIYSSPDWRPAESLCSTLFSYRSYCSFQTPCNMVFILQYQTSRSLQVSSKWLIVDDKVKQTHLTTEKFIFMTFMEKPESPLENIERYVNKNKIENHCGRAGELQEESSVSTFLPKSLQPLKHPCWAALCLQTAKQAL